MLDVVSLPFVLHHQQMAVSNMGTTATQERLHGLLRLDDQHLTLQWRTTREVNQFGKEARSEQTADAVQEIALPLAQLSGVHVKRVWKRLPPSEAVVITAADLSAFEALHGQGHAAALLLAHPAELSIPVRRADRQRARDFVRTLQLRLSERLLSDYHERPNPPL